MKIMTAGVHDALFFRGIIQSCFFLHRKRINIRTQQHALSLGFSVNACPGAGFIDVAIENSEAFQFTANKSRCSVFLSAEFRMGMQIPPCIPYIFVINFV